MRRLYTGLLYAAVPVVLARMLWRSRRDPRYRRRWRERFGYGPAVSGGGIWLHAVSVGEVRAARPLVQALLERHPDVPLHLTTVTPTGAELAGRLFGGRITCSYLPWDLPGAVGRFLDRVRPALALVMETELWPNLFHACGARGIPLCLLNARLSAPSLQRYRRVAGLARATLGNATLVAARGPADAQRFLQLGAAAVQVTGDLKFEQPAAGPVPDVVQRWRADRPVWLAASTHAGEEEQVLEAFAAVRDAALLLVPRHPERAQEIVALCRARGFDAVLSSGGGDAGGAVMVVDSLGELPALFAAADVAFLGGSLVPHGGHNPLEAAAAAVPVLTGPWVVNFEDIFAAMRAAGAAREVGNAEELAAGVQAWLDDPAARQRAGATGRALMDRHPGAVAATMALLEPHLPSGDPPPL